MGRRAQHLSKDGFNRGAWTSLEDQMLTDYVSSYGEGKWSNVAKKTGLKRCGKSCRLRWLNYLRPDIKRGNISRDEEELIVRLHKLLGNRWSLIAGRLPGRTDNEIKNYWNSTLAKKIQNFHFTLPKVSTYNNLSAIPTPPPPTSTLASGSEDDRNLEPTRPAGDDETTLPDFLLDFNMEDFCHILDSNNNKDQQNEEKCWDGNYKGSDQSGDQLIDDSDFLSIVPFLDSDQVMDWSELA